MIIYVIVTAVITVKDEEDATRVAKDFLFGLGACVITQDLERREIITEYESVAGPCFVNHYVSSNPALPFGGFRTSGYKKKLSY